MRVGVITNAYYPVIGGIETHARYLCEEIAAAGDTVEVLTQDMVRRPSAGTVDGVLVRRFPLTVTAANYRFSVSLWSWLRREAARYDVLHAHGYHALAALGAAVTNRKPLVFTPHYHGTGHSRLRSQLHHVYRPLGRRLLGRATSVICVSEAERDLLIRDFPAVATRVTVIPNGVDPEPLRAARERLAAAALPRSAGITGSIVAIGRVETYKRLDAVVRALCLLPCSVRLTIAGHGPAVPALRLLAEQLGTADRVSFTGRLDACELADTLVAADAFVSASSHEAFGLSIADAMTAGVPVVASDIPAHREVAGLAGSDVLCTFVDIADIERLACALASTLAAPRRPIGATSLPSWQHVAALTSRVLAGAVTRPALGRTPGG